MIYLHVGSSVLLFINTNQALTVIVEFYAFLPEFISACFDFQVLIQAVRSPSALGVYHYLGRVRQIPKVSYKQSKSVTV